MKVVWKFPITGEVKMPGGAEILSVGQQRGEPFLWALCDPHKPDEIRKFRIVGTGHEFDGLGNFLGRITIEADLGIDEVILEWHVFEVNDEATI